MHGCWRRMLFALVLAAAATPALAVDESDLLPVDQAFALSASAPTREGIALHWRIADGYYLYRQRISVRADDGFHARGLQLPPGASHHDEFFGDVQTYRHQVTATLPGTASADNATLTIKYQGCADLGVCYPPQTRTLQVALPAQSGAATATTAAPGDDLGALGRALAAGPAAQPAGLATGSTDAQPLPPEQAFGFEAIVDSPAALLLRFTPAKGYYLYRDKTTLRTSGASGVAVGTPRWPTGVPHRDAHFGDVVVYFDQVDVPLPLLRRGRVATDVTLHATFQGCQTDGICYPPMTRTVSLTLPPATALDSATAGPTSTPVVGALTPTANDAVALSSVASAAATASDPAPADTGSADDSRLAAGLSGAHRWLALFGFFGAGLLLAFTPCVLPMIPILSGLIAGQGTRLGTRRAVLLSLVYVVANALVFTVAGVVAGLLGANLQVAFQQPWIIVAFALLFVALALSSFGLYELQLPAVLRARLGEVTDRQRGGALPGVAAMGALSALIVGPCVAPPLAGAVLYIGQSRDPVFGGVALFLLAMGMGLPLLAFGAAAGRGMPTSGPWMTAAQRAFGFVFLALAVWMLSRILPGTLVLALYGLLALAAAARMALARVGPPWLSRFAGIALAIVGAAQLLGALSGASDPLQPLARLSGKSTVAPGLAFETIKTSADLDRRLAQASASGQPLLLDFYADWCVSCKEMERYTFADPAVHAALDGAVLLKADVTANDADDQALMQRLGIIGPPATLFFHAGTERRALRLVGFEPAARFVERIRRASQ